MPTQNRQEIRHDLKAGTVRNMELDQSGCCAICREYKGSKLVVDHDHATGKIRQLLCVNCNLGLGRFFDDITKLFRAIRYLIKHK